MGLILDLAVAALALVVIGSLALLAWTLAVGATRAVRDGQRRVSASRSSIAEADERIRSSAARASASLEGLDARIRSLTPGERPTHDDQQP
ncbi:MAG: hypothetical protein ABIW50_05640, partial [Candidatus Limnocylindria bacterium]